jgi:NAD(P)-dependent dehydrogenase (short-subunit alcohol dehydrogenase family)
MSSVEVKGNAGQTNYAAQKRALLVFKSVALELGSRIRCNVIAPIYRNGNDGQIKRRCGKGWREEFH